MADIYAKTVATYRTEAGAKAFVAKEDLHAERRNAQAFAFVDDVDVRGLTVLDVGCGFGRDVVAFAARGADAYGCDVSEALLEEGRARFGEVVAGRLAVADLRGEGALPFQPERGFDLIWCCAVLVHVPRKELAAVLGRMWDALASGGRLAITTKIGEGERVMANLGEGLERVMVYYRLHEIVDVLERLGGIVEVANDAPTSVIATGDSLMVVRARKA